MSSSTQAREARTRSDRCPGVLRPWVAEDGALVRVRLVGGHLSTASLRSLLDLAAIYGDGSLHLTKRANVQLRGLPLQQGSLPPEVVRAFERAGLLPSHSHELVRNIMVSPGSGVAGGRADLYRVAEDLDRELCANPTLAGLPGRFLFVLDDGRGDLVSRTCDLGLVVVDDRSAQVRLGSTGWGPVVRLHEAAGALIGVAHTFARVRGLGVTAAWHVDELEDELEHLASPRDPRVPSPTGPLPFGDGPAGTHLEVPDGHLTPYAAEALLDSARAVVVTPWHGVLLLREEMQ